MIPWVRVDTAEILSGRLRQRWTPENPAPRVIALAELGVLVSEGMIQRESIQALAVGWGYSRGKVRRLLVEWASSAASWGHVPGLDALPSWWPENSKRTPNGHPADTRRTPIPEEEQEHTGTAGHPADTLRTSHARDPLIEREIEKKKDPPIAPPGGAERKRPRASDLSPQEQALYAAWRAHHPRAQPEPGRPQRRALRQLLADAGGLDDALLLVAWAHESGCRWARQLRGEEPWPNGGGLVTRTDLTSLSRSVESRLAQARTWDARGRTDAPPAVAAGGDGAGFQAEHEAIRQLWGVVDRQGRADPPRQRQAGGGWVARWDWPAPEGCPDPGRWSDAAVEAVDACGGWSALTGASARERAFIGRRFGAEVGRRWADAPRRTA